LAADPEVMGLFPDATRFSVKQWVWNRPLGLVRINEELLQRKSSSSGLEN
jgi:hypothetical protein